MVYTFYSKYLPDWYNEELAKYPNTLTRDDENDLARKIQSIDKVTIEYQNTVNELFFPKRNDVAEYVMGIRYHNVPLLDQMVRGAGGMYDAILKFNPNKSDCLDAWAKFPIRNGVRKAFLDYRKGLHASQTTLSKASKFKKYWRNRERSIGEEIPLEEAARDYDLDPVIAKRYIKLLDTREVSINERISGEDVRRIEDSLVDEDLLEKIDQKKMSDLYKEILKLREEVLNDREEVILDLRYGLDGNEVHTLEQCKKIFGVSVARIEQIEKASIKKLKWAYLL